LELWDHGHRRAIACIQDKPEYFSHPAFAPDGRTIAYVKSTAPTSQAQDWGDDIYTADPDGSNQKLLLHHNAPGSQVDSIAWSSDAKSLLYGSFLVKYGEAGRTASATYSINRLDLTTGSVSIVIRNASQAALSPDGKLLSYVSYPSGDLNASFLAIAGADGSDPHPILNGQNGFQSFFAPHLSPDRGRVVFAAIGGPLSGRPDSAKLDVLQSLRSMFSAALAPSARADGSPYEVWVANLDGTGMHPVANLREDLPYPQWSTDGKQILFLGAAALYLGNADGSGVKQIDKGVAHGQIDWYQR
jgi:Tol biopolymer transport system component